MEKVFDGIYKDKKVLITGHTGFKGSWLSLWLTQMGATVIGYSIDKPTEPNHFDLLNLPVKNIFGDIRDKENLKKVIIENKPDIIFHLAAQALVIKSYKDPENTFSTNIIGTLNILEICRELNLKVSIVNVTSDKCYRNDNKDIGYIETDPLGGDDPYSASKGCAEILSNAYRKSFFDPENFGKTHHVLLADVRAGNVIGGGDWAKDRIVPDIMIGAAKKEVVIIRNPKAIRPWQHVLEPVYGYLEIGKKLLEHQATYADNWNFGPINNETFSVETLVEKAQVIWTDIKFEKSENEPSSLKETKVLKLDSTKSKKQTMWSPVWNTAEAIEKTVLWYKKYYNNGYVCSIDDLNEYIQKMLN